MHHPLLTLHHPAGACVSLSSPCITLREPQISSSNDEAPTQSCYDRHWDYEEAYPASGFCRQCKQLHQHEPRLAGAIGNTQREKFQLGIRAQCRRPPSPARRARRASFGSQPDHYSDTTARVSRGERKSASVAESVRSKVFNHARKVYKEKMGTTEVPSTLHRPSPMYVRLSEAQ